MAINWFSFLKHLDIPQKYPITHNIVEKLVESDIDLVESDESLGYDDIVDHSKLSPKQKELEKSIKTLSTAEAAFQIAQTEYENKEKRFLDKTTHSQQSLDQIYAEKRLVLRDINDDKILDAIKSRNTTRIIETLNKAESIISEDVDVFYARRDHLIKLWEKISQELYDKIKSFEFRGLKVVSSNLRVKLLPTLEEFKQDLNEPKFKDESLSRAFIEERLYEMVEQAREDLYGDLTNEQIILLNDINPDLDKDELIDLLVDDEKRKDLIVLLETDKITLRMKKVIDRLI